jgi:uncharacterized protein (DUF1499 family)
MMAGRLAVLGLVLFGTGPLLARLEIVPALAGFALFAVGGLLGVVALVWGGVAALRGRGGWLAPAIGLAISAVFVGLALPSRAYPPYNDFTTDPDEPPAFVKAGELPANRGRDLVYPGGAVTAAQREAYPDLRPLDLPEPPAAVFARAAALARGMPEWEITLEDGGAGAIEAVATTRLFRFRDDVVIRVRAHGDGTRVDMRSKSRDGRGDLGANALRIRTFLAALRSGS